jgi:cyclopropane-fatty-acyl-phospholipid synthase
MNQTAARSGRRPDTVADAMRPVVHSILGGDPGIKIRFWDGSSIGPDHARTTMAVQSPHALRRLLYQPNELGFGRAYVAGEIDIDGDIYAALDLRDLMAGRDEGVQLGLTTKGLVEAWRAARSLGVLGRPIPPPPEEAHLKGRRHTAARDAAAISYHYDVGNDFYRLVLGPTMTYSCGFFYAEGVGLDEAQVAKYDLICRKLGLEPGMRLLDVGCGWGGMVMHAARHYGVTAVGVTISREQADLARQRLADAGLSDQVQIRLQDYRDIDDGPFDAISSIGMFEHVGVARLEEYFERLYRLVRPEGRVLNHGISRPPGPARFQSKSFIERYVFPDGELHEVGSVTSAMQRQRLEVRDVESLREHYARTLRHWVANLEANWNRAVELVGPNRARVWRMYMAGAALGFEAGRTSIHQVLAVRSTAEGTSGMPRTRSAFLGEGTTVDLRAAARAVAAAVSERDDQVSQQSSTG